MRNPVKIRPLAAERKLSRGLFEQLAEQIKSGRLAPGAPADRAGADAAARVSRTVVREAVAALRAEGLVVTRQGVGAFVSAEPRHAPFRIEPERMQTLADILNVMELRLGVEIESAGIAAERASARSCAASARPEAIEQERRGKVGGGRDLGFHRAIADATGNPGIPALPAVHRPPPHPAAHGERAAERMGGQKAYLALIQEEHRRIFEAIRSRDPGAAREAMRRHLTRSLERYRKLAAERQEAA